MALHHTLTGSRQSGKTTLARHILADRPYCSLEDPDVRAILAQFPDGAVLDEIQRVPVLFSYLQTHVDQEARLGRFLLTGSQQFSLLSSLS